MLGLGREGLAAPGAGMTGHQEESMEIDLLLCRESTPAYAYVLVVALCGCEAAAPFPVRAAWAAFLRQHEPDPEQMCRAAVNVHERGHLRAGQLTSSGVLAALEALRGMGNPPRSIDRPQTGPGGD